ncbi:protein cordon-bleu isoform X2 [Pseudophryne corroboree]|uniref:protein cordon-bleu isoform X2 n=1 Tax=Pseudophryne corroboree TaxID=495146 RepID=UPI0030817C03
MSCVVRWQPAKDYVPSQSAVSGLSGAKKLSLSLGDLTKDKMKSRKIGVTLGTYIITSSKKIKGRAPPPPIHCTSKPRMEHMSSSDSDGTGNQSTEESKENVLHRKVDLTICFPDGQQKAVTVDGSKAVMDFLVDLCSQHHLNPAQHTLEVRSGSSQQPLTLRPNTLIGTLDVQTVFLKEKVTEVKVRKPPPKIPEKTVRLVVNFLGTQKAVVRVNPAVPLRNILPAVCEKCEFNQENVTLLRDAFSKEELDMSQSLNDLGIKELYAWNSKIEKNRNLSSGSDTTDKEKKGIFGFLRSFKKGNKNEGSIGNLDGDDYEEVFRTASTSGNRCEGFLTAPSSPTVNSRSATLGASLSLSNISGIGAGTEMKKRKAPPPPKSPAEENAAAKTPEAQTAEPVYTTVKKEKQKTKRKAPPPPTLQMPNEKTEDLENRSSTAQHEGICHNLCLVSDCGIKGPPWECSGNGRQVPQKPPRGTSRSPPQLIIPPPPPYPPPDNDITDPPVFENGATVTGPTRPIPAKRGKHLSRWSRVSSEEVSTTDDAGSVNSYTEDSGIVSSPSDNVSIDLQNNGTKRRENNNKGTEADETYTVYLQPNRAESFTSEDSLSLHTSSVIADDEVSLVRNGEEDHFIAAQFQETLAELDEDSEDLDDGDNDDSNLISSQSSTVSEESNPYQDFREHGASVPVTIIDEVPEIPNYSLKSHIIPPAKEYNAIQQTSVVGNTKNNYVSDGESIARKTNVTANNTLPPGSHIKKSSMDSSKLSAENFRSSTSKHDYSTNASYKQNNTKENSSLKQSMSAPTIKASNPVRPVKDRADVMPDHKQKVEIKDSHGAQHNMIKVIEPAKPTLWRQQTYEPKVGMTTFTVVPPKPDVKKYDRNVSLTASAIKIDDLGNLISPQSSFEKDESVNVKNETEGPLVERAKEFWRSNSVDSQAADSKELSVRRFISVKNQKPNQAPENKPNSSSSISSTPPLPINKLNDRNNGSQQTKPVPAAVPHMIIMENTSKTKIDMPFLKPILNERVTGLQHNKAVTAQHENMIIIENTIKGKPVLQPTHNDKVKESQQTKPAQLSTVSQERMIITEQTNKERKDLPFLKPSNRTSSQYVASAISKYTEPLNRKSTEIAEAKQETNYVNRSFPLTSASKTPRNFTVEAPKAESKPIIKQETSTHLRTNLGTSNGQVINKNPQMESISKSISDHEQLQINIKKDSPVAEKQTFNGSQSLRKNTAVTIVENSEKTTGIAPTAPVESSHPPKPPSAVPYNAFLKAVREKSQKKEQTSLIGPVKAPPIPGILTQKETKHDTDFIPSTVIDELDSAGNNILFGPKANLRPVVQKPMQQDSSLHSALMGAIQSGEGKERLRKIQSSPTDGGDRKFAEPENERSALLSAIRGHNGMSRLKKISSAAADELQTIRNKESSFEDDDSATSKTLSIPPPPLMPPPPPPPGLVAAPKLSPVFPNNSIDRRDALMEAIRSGAGASGLKKVPASVQRKRKY